MNVSQTPTDTKNVDFHSRLQSGLNLLDINSSTCLRPLAKTVEVHKLLPLLLFPSPDRARLRNRPVRAFCRHAQAAASSQHCWALVQPDRFSHSCPFSRRALFSSASPFSSFSYIPRASQCHCLNSPLQVSSHPPTSYHKILSFFP